MHGYSEEVLIGMDLFKNRDFRFITEVPGKGIHKKQEEALYLLTDDETQYLLYGGGANGAKSWTGSVWLMEMALLYPGTRWFLGRKELKAIIGTTLQTFFKAANNYGLVRSQDYKYNAQGSYILFSNGSRIDLLELKFKPSDPLYERFGSFEYTGGWIEEGGEVDFRAFDTLLTRIGRHLNDKYGLLAKILITCNPKRNWIYSEFYQPYKTGKLPKGYRFIPSLVLDNPHRESGSEQQLIAIKDKARKERLLNGNFDYDDDPAALCEYDAIMDLFTNDHVKPTGQKAISADLAMQGRDRFIAGPWDGMVLDLTKGIDKEKATGKSIETDLKQLMITCGVGRSRTVVDSDGLGNYLESYLVGIKEFHNGSTAVNKTEYANLKSECAYMLADIVNSRAMKIICSPEQQERIAEELAVLKRDDVDADEKKKRIIDKKEMKKLLNRSPDYLDMLIMRMFFEIKPKGTRVVFS